VYFEKEVIDFCKFGLCVSADKVCGTHENLQMPGNRDMPPAVDPAPLPDEVRDSVLKKLHVVASAEFHVFVARPLSVQTGAKRVNAAADLAGVGIRTKCSS
jgi:hypothetical protein